MASPVHRGSVAIGYDLFILRTHLYASAHFTTRFPGHAFCSTQVDGDKDKNIGKHMKGPIGNTTRQANARREEKKWGARQKEVMGSSCWEWRVPQQVAASDSMG